MALWSSRRVEALVGTPCVAFTRPRLVRMSRCPVVKCFLIDGSSETCETVQLNEVKGFPIQLIPRSGDSRRQQALDSRVFARRDRS